ncbi:hypothetical protein SAMD00023353_0300870 [Rosellinia necatrix]|uniref:Uncharacterized protein n=1 Tax=Rosellinia necatrix TaxID=77044 RepID=A0A1W2TDB2_ROSNE|nr:hypothetical protein SAMD00023353_0300870 [Rosellinia necatrix]
MLGLLRAALLLVPTLELALAAAPERAPAAENITPNSLITLELGGNLDGGPLQPTTLDLRVFESITPCGYGNVTINGEQLAQDGLGIGSGSIPTDSGTVLVADWKFTCVHVERDTQAQLLSVHVISVDGENVDDMAFSIQFRQTQPVSISYIDGVAVKPKPLSAPDSSDKTHPNLEDELAELELLKEQLVELERSIALKITFISDSFNLDRPEELLQAIDCKGLKCFFSTIYYRVKTVAGKLYHGNEETQESLEDHPGTPYWPSSYRGQRPLAGTGGVESLNSVPSPHEPVHVGGQNEAADLISMGAGQPLQANRLNEPRVLHMVALVVAILAIVINLAIMILIFQCVRLLRQRRRARWEKRRSQLRASRAACNTLVASKYMDLIQWLRDGLRRENVEDQEKDAIMRQIRGSDSDDESSDTLSITMEEEIAQFRAAANAVGNLVVAEEGRGRGQNQERERERLSGRFSLTRPRRSSTPSSIMSSCPTYRSVDESLPPYDENCSPEYVADGFQHSASSSITGSSSSRSSIFECPTIRSSLDENVEQKD